MKKQRGLRSVFIPALLVSSLLSHGRDAAAFTVETSSILSEPAVKEEINWPDPARHIAFAVKMRSMGNLQEAKRALADMRSARLESPWDKRAAFLSALIAADEGAPGAPALFEEAAGIPAIDDYVVFYQADALMKGSRYVEAAGAYQFIISSYPDSLLKEKSSFLLGMALLKADDNDGASKAFRRFIAGWPKSRHIPEANLRLAESLVRQGLNQEALAPLKEVSTGYPTSVFSIESDFLLSTLDFGAPVAGAFSPGERFRRSENFFVSAKYEKALKGYATLLKESAFREMALFRTAVANARLKRYDESEKALREYLSIGNGAREAEALYWLALVSTRQGREEGVLEAERLLSRKYRKSNERAKVLILLAGIKGGKDPEGALLAYNAVLEEFSGSAVSDEAFWRRAWDAYRAGRTDDAYEAFSSYLEAKPKGRLADQFLYWQARSAERLGRTEEAQVLFGKVCAAMPRSFYCLMAEVRLSRGAGEPEEVLKISSPVEGQAVPALQVSEVAASPEKTRADSFRQDPRYNAATELMLLGLNEHASGEIESLAKGHAKDRASLAKLATLLYETSDFYRAFRIYRTHLSASDEPEHNALGFPMLLVDKVRERSAPKAADPFLVAAVMREESHFNPEAVSPVGAMGLMQIMPATGRQIARELGERLGKGGLLNPATSIRFGSWYLGQLFKRFEGDVVLTIAGYNAGPNAAARWAGALPKETDEFIESIPYEETRGYVKRVLRSYSEFLRLGNEEFRGRVLRPLPLEEASAHEEASVERDRGLF